MLNLYVLFLLKLQFKNLRSDVDVVSMLRNLGYILFYMQQRERKSSKILQD